MSKEALRGASRVEDLARIYTMVGEYDAAASFNIPTLAQIHVLIGDYDVAIDRLEQVLSVPSIISVPLFRFDPLWDPLRDHPRFQALLARYEN